MTTRLFALGPAFLLVGGLAAQQQQPVWFQTVNCIKVQPGKSSEFREIIDTFKKVIQQRVNEGRIVSWSMLRSVMPAGEEARCDYLGVTLYENAPPEPLGREGLEKALKSAGVSMTAADYIARRDSVSRLVATEMWQPQIRVGQPAKGNYAFINYMKVHNFPDYSKFESTVWRPVAEVMVKEGFQTGWVFSTKLLPGGTEVQYGALTADIYPNWEEVFKNRDFEGIFKKAHPDKNADQTMGTVDKLRDLARRELYYIEERVSKQ
jgi:hypothetical protein